MSPTPANFFRAAVLLVLAAHVFMMYGLARGLSESFGFSVATAVTAMLFSLAMLVPLVWAVTIPELPEIYTTHWRARRWWRAGRCGACGYPRRGDGETCSECGGLLAAPAGYRVSRKTIRRYIAINLLALIMGASAAEAWTLDDERLFKTEARQCATLGRREYVREARWPRNAVLVWNAQDGYAKMPDYGVPCTVPAPAVIRRPLSSDTGE